MLVDPRGETFGVVANHAAQFGKALHLPDAESARYNPFDFIRDDEAAAVRDIDVLLDALLTPPAGEQGNSRHFYESARSLIAGYMAWVRFREPPEKRNLAFLHRLLSKGAKEQEMFGRRVKETEPFCGGLAHLAVERETRVGKEEGGSNFTTIANQLAFMTYPELAAHTAESTFDPEDIAEGDVDLFVVCPEEALDRVRGWIRLGIAIPNAIPSRRALGRGLLLVLDEMPRLGFLQPVMDAYNTAAGRGIHFWSFAQSLSALEATWGRERCRTLVHLAEVVQILGFPRMDDAGAEALSAAIGSATFENRSENMSDTVQDARLLGASRGETLSVIKERLVTPDDLMTMGPDEQYVVAAGSGRKRRRARSGTGGDFGAARRVGDPGDEVFGVAVRGTRRGAVRAR